MTNMIAIEHVLKLTIPMSYKLICQTAVFAYCKFYVDISLRHEVVSCHILAKPKILLVTQIIIMYAKQMLF